MFWYSIGCIVYIFLTILIKIKKKKTTFSFRECFLLFLGCITTSILIQYLSYLNFNCFRHMPLYLLSFFIFCSGYLTLIFRKEKGYFKLFIKLLFIFSVLELFLFNFRHFESLRYESIDVSSIQGVGTTIRLDDETFELHPGKADEELYIEAAVEIKNIDLDIKNIYVDAYLLSSRKTKMKIVLSATDEANRYYFTLPERTLVPNVKESKYMKLHLSGQTDKLKLTFRIREEHVTDGSILKINKITFNKTVPLNIFFPRILLLSLAIVLITMIRPSSELWKVKLNFQDQKQKLIILGVAFLEIAYLTVTVFSNGTWLNNDSSKAQTEFHKLAVSLKKGQFYLDDPVSDILKELDNPYDITLRRKAFKNTEETYLWDYAYYEGKYYVYFGVVPVFLAYLPASYIIGDFTLPNFVYIYTMGILIVVASYFLLKEIVSRYFKNIPTLLFILLWLFFIQACQLPYMMHRPDFYSIPIISALMFTLSGLYLWLSSTRDEHLSKGRMVLGSLCMALVAGCRPQFLLGSFFCFPIFYESIKKKDLLSKKGMKNTILFMLPYVIIAAFLMYYNYARFGSVLDFGANYNLTTNDMTRRGFVLERIPLGLYTYLFEPVDTILEFPFMEPSVIETNYLGRTISEQFLGGAVSVHLLLLFSLFVFKFKKCFQNQKLYIVSCMATIFALVVIILDTEMAGILPRYLADFTWLLLISTILIILSIYSSMKDEKIQSIFKTMIVIGVLITLLYSFLLIFVDITYSLCNTGPYLFYKIYHMFMFFL